MGNVCLIIDERAQEGILLTLKNVREARGKFTQYKIIYRYYFSPTRLNKMGLLDNDLCWMCGENSGTFTHVLWECSKVLPL